MLITMDFFYGAFEMCMGHYDLDCYRRNLLKQSYQPLLQIGPDWQRDADLLLMVRTVTAPGTRIIGEALGAGVPAGYYLDDDLLHLHEYGPPFYVLAPDQERRRDLETQIAAADAVWVTSPGNRRVRSFT